MDCIKVPYITDESITTNNNVVVGYRSGNTVMVTINGINTSEVYITGLPKPYDDRFTVTSLFNSNLNGINGFIRYIAENNAFLIRRITGSDLMYGTLVYICE